MAVRLTKPVLHAVSANPALQNIRLLMQMPAPGTIRHPPYLRLESLDRLFTDSSIEAGTEGKPQKLTPPGQIHTALRFIDPQLHSTAQVIADTLQDPSSRAPARDANVQVIRIAHKPVPPTLKLFVQLIQHQIRQ